MDDVIDTQQYYNPLYFSLQCRHLFFGGRLLNLVFGRYFGFAKRRGLGGVKRVGRRQGRERNTTARKACEIRKHPLLQNTFDHKPRFIRKDA